MGVLSRAIALTVILLAAAGCVAPPEDAQPQATPDAAGPLVPPIPDFDFSTVVDPDHASHLLPELHQGGHGLALKGHAPLGDLVPPGTSAAITQIDVWGTWALVSGMEGGMAFAIVDISDPAAPKAVSWFPSPANGWTARFSDDGSYVFYGCQMLGPPYVSTANLIGDCEDPRAPHAPGQPAAGVVAVDVTDKAAPKFVDFLETGGSHNLFVTSVNGTDYVFTAATTILRFDREAGTLEQVAEVPGRHDATVARHPITGDLLLFTGTGELSIYDVDDPAKPELIFEGEGDEGWRGWHEQTLIPAVVDGRVILALGGETNTATTGGVADAVAFVDVTDPRTPTLLSQWKPPFEAKLPWTSYLYSVHEMAATVHGQLAVSWYHAGVWVLDVSTQERQAEPVVLAAYLPHALPDVVPPLFEQTPVPTVPNVWSVAWDDRGYVVVPDMYTGVYVLEPEWGLHPTVASGA